MNNSNMEDMDVRARRDRVTENVLARIAQAPPRFRAVTPVFNVQRWAITTLAAASIIMAVSIAALMHSQPAESTVWDAVGVPRSLAQYVDNGTIDPLDPMGSGWAP